MFVNITHDTKGEHARLFTAGIAFLTVMAVLVGLSIAIYDKAFSHPTMVTIKAQSAGLQLARFGDVRRHGALVGSVREISNDGKQAVIKIALTPSAAKDIPENISVDILPTTLFGQKYISIIDPSDPSSKSLSNGDVIPASRVRTNVELQKILADLFPLLRSIRPADLSSTLYALATALRGRGDELGQTFVKLDSYLTTMNVHLPTLQQDLVLLARVSKTYAIAAPDLVRLLRNATTTAHTVTDKQADLKTFFTDVTGLGKTSTRVLSVNEANIVRAPAVSRPLLGLLDTYSPELPCLLKGAARYAGRLNQIFSKARVAQSMSLAATQRRPYDQRDVPAYGEHGSGPKCYGLPYPKVPLEPPVNFKNGTELDSTTGGNPEQ
jgi:phospholipid/cholesterol/gamma-HCH transport system substrate-binding protein